MNYVLMHKGVPVAAPIFGSGSSLGYDKLPSRILGGKVECKPFKKSHEEQLGLVTALEWVDFGKLKGLEDEARGIFDRAGEYMTPPERMPSAPR